MMVEAEATDNVIELIAGGAGAPTEAVVAEGLEAAKPFIAALCTAQQELADEAAKPTAEYPVFPDYQDDVFYAVSSVATDELSKALTIAGKEERNDRTDEIKVEVLERLAETYAGREKEIGAAYRSLTKKLVRQRILTDHFRIDGRGVTDIRALSAEVAVDPAGARQRAVRARRDPDHGCHHAGHGQDGPADRLAGTRDQSKRYMHHYNFPPYSTGETGRVGSPKRREIGHGALAERALMPVLPSVEEFPYAIRQVSEALSSNGSTSMGSVCASTLSLLNAGVPLKAPVAGIAMGLVSDDVEVDDGSTERRFVTLTDILGAEDAFGDMDFKCAGTKDFVTALQLDTKLDGIPSKVLAGALAQAKDARITILEVMAEAIDEPDEMSPYAPRITTIKVPIDKIGEVIGPKGKMINSITEQTGASISIEDDGTVFVGATDGDVGAGRDRHDQRDRQPAAAQDRRAVPRNRGQDNRFRCVRVAAARPRRAGAHLQARPGQAHRQGRGRGEGRRQAACGDRRYRQPRQDLAGPGRRRRRERRSRVARVDACRCHDRQLAGRRRLRRVRGGNEPRRSPTVRRTTLPGGLRVVTEYIPSVRSASVGVWVGVGSRDEGSSVAGAAHFLEHLLFKSTPTRSAVEIAQAVDAVGGELNAFTAREHTCYYAHVLDTRPGAGRRPGRRRGAARSVCGRGRRARTRRRARGDRHARRRSRRTLSATCSCRRCSARTRSAGP